MGRFGQKSAGFIRVWGCGILSEIGGSGSTNVRLDFSDFGMLVDLWKVGGGYIWFSSSQGCPDLRFWGLWLSATVSGYEKWWVVFEICV